MKKELTEIEAKRNQRKKKIRKRRLIVFSVFMLLVCAVVLFVLLKTKLFPVKNISASGSALYTAEQIVEASGIDGKTPIFGISEKKTEENIIKMLPFIESVKIKRKFPDSVQITVTDAKEYFAFRTDGGYAITNKNTRVLNISQTEELPEGVIEVIADGLKFKTAKNVEFKNDTQKELFEILTSYPEDKNMKLNSVDITDTVQLKIRIEDRFDVNLGNRENLKNKIDHLAGMITTMEGKKGKINLESWSQSDKKAFFTAEN